MMSKHYIYEIFGRKIGATNDVERRMKQQGVKEGEYRIIEEHTNAKICSIREIELQKEYNYPVDRIQYWKTLRFQKKGATPEARKKAVANTDYKAKAANTDYKTSRAKINWEQKVAKMDYSNFTMTQCNTPEAIAKRAKTRSRAVNQYDLEGNLLKQWESITSAATTLGFGLTGISNCCKNKGKTSHKFIWKYAR
jgi:hypothetical protein